MDVKLQINFTVVAKKADGSDYVIEERRSMRTSDQQKWEKVKNKKVGEECRGIFKNRSSKSLNLNTKIIPR